MSSFEGRRVLVVGLGASGFSAARALVTVDAKVRVTESSTSRAIEERARRLQGHGVEVETGGHDLSHLDADLAVISPGIPPSAPVVTALRRQRVETISEIELAYRLATEAGEAPEFLAITGTNGKTTTTSLLASMLVESGVPSLAAGNIGLPLIDAISTLPSHGALAVEVSSFQLAAIDRFRPRVAVLLNVAEDHTDWHGSFERYVGAKARIVENQGPDDVFVVNADDRTAMSIAQHAPSRVVPFSASRVPEGGIGIDGSDVGWRGQSVFRVGSIPLRGAGGKEDALAAAAAALEFGVAADAVVRALERFRPPAHRLQVVSEARGITYVDDSKATNPHATLAAVRGLSNVVLIAGGRSKGIDLTPLRSVAPSVVAVIAIGEAASQIEAVLADLVPVERAASMDEAVALASRRASPGATVLLSPACASFDMYDGYAQRGDDFVRSVRDLVGREEAARRDH